MTHPSTNLDAAFLRQLTEGGSVTGDELRARLLRIADNIDALDLANSQAYQLGLRDGEGKVYARSNLISPSRVITPRAGTAIAQALGVEVKKIPQGVRALDDLPDFNGRKAKPKAVPAPQLNITLDLTDLGDL